MFGARGGEPCGVHHVMAKMTLGYLQNRLYRMTDYRIVVDIKRSASPVTTKEKAAGVKTHVFRFTNFTGHDPRKDTQGRRAEPVSGRGASSADNVAAGAARPRRGGANRR
jgi:hypothetical protein